MIENTEQQPVREVGVELKNEMHAAASVCKQYALCKCEIHANSDTINIRVRSNHGVRWDFNGNMTENC